MAFTPKAALVQYNRGTPQFTGVYACRVPLRDSVLCEDRFLVWMNDEKRWYYPSSDQRFRNEVKGWVGPLQRRIHG